MTLHHTISDWLWFGFFVTLFFDMTLGFGVDLPSGFVIINAQYDGRKGDARLWIFNVRRLVFAVRALMITVTALYGAVLLVAGFVALAIHAPLIFPLSVAAVALVAGLIYGAYRLIGPQIPDGDLRLFYFRGKR